MPPDRQREVFPGGGWLEVNPAFGAGFARLGITTPSAFLDLPGEVVSGHPDRHVRRVELDGFPAAFYLKRQHVVTWRERFRNRRDGFGWVSRSEREAEILSDLEAAGLPGPRWAAAGEDGRGRAFLLLQELTNCVDLRRHLSASLPGDRERAVVVRRLGSLVARIHAAGLTTPDLTAKHLLVNQETGAITPIDWPAARRVSRFDPADLVRALAALDASVGDESVSPRERLCVLRAIIKSSPANLSFADLARGVARESGRLRSRRSWRDQRAPNAGQQRLVWLAGEAVCAIPEVAATWPTPAVAAPFYGCEPDRLAIRLADGRAADLIRGRSFAPAAMLVARLRGRPWRSPGASLGRVLFHLERYGVPAPHLLAFGQHHTGLASAEWFALHTPPAPAITTVSPDVAEELGRCLRLLHDAGCRPAGAMSTVFGWDGRACIRDVSAIRIVKRLSPVERSSDLRRLAAAFGAAVEAGYRATSERRSVNSGRLIPVGVSG